MAELRIHELVKDLGGHRAVDGVDLTVPDGELLVLLGSSGCGKTTTLRMVCGLEIPDSGRVLLGGKDITRATPRTRNLGMVFQEYGLYPTMDVYRNMAYGLEARGGVAKDEIDRRIKEAAERLGLTELLRNNIGDLSGGEQQRVALGRAMVKDAEAYLFDEPLSNLDPKLRHRARRDILALHRAKGKPSVYVTHDQSEAFAMADRIAVMSGGRVRQTGTTEQLVDEPADTFVASFIGSPPMNLLDGVLERSGGTVTATAANVTTALPGRWLPALADGDRQPVTVGIPPDALLPGAPGAPTEVLEAVALGVDPLIGETVVKLDAGTPAALYAVLRGPDEDAAEEGRTLHLRIDPDRVRLFDPAGGKALLG